jgi:hypothetical protein
MSDVSGAVDVSSNVSDAHVPNAGVSQPVAADNPADSAPATTGDTPADTPSEQPDKGKADAGLQKAINRLTRQRGDAERRAMRLEAELEVYRKGTSPQPQPQARASELKESDFANYGEFVRAQAREIAREELAAQRQEQSQREASQAAGTARQAFEREAAEQAKAAGIDFEDSWETLLSLPKDDVSEVAAAYFFEAAENKAALVHHFANDPDELARISHLPPIKAVRELARIDARLGATKPPARTSSAPPPVPTVGGRSVTTRDPKDMDMKEYASAWNARRASKH